MGEFEIPEELLVEELQLSDEPLQVTVPPVEVVAQPTTDLAAGRPARPSIPRSAWDPRLIFDLALGVDDLNDILDRHKLTEEQLSTLFGNKMFRSEVAALRMDMQKDGVTLRTKAKLQAESYLTVLDGMVHDIHTSASVRLSAIQQVCKLGDVEPKKDAQGAAAGGGYNIQINIM